MYGNFIMALFIKESLRNFSFEFLFVRTYLAPAKNMV